MGRGLGGSLSSSGQAVERVMDRRAIAALAFRQASQLDLEGVQNSGALTYTQNGGALIARTFRKWTPNLRNQPLV